MQRRMPNCTYERLRPRQFNTYLEERLKRHSRSTDIMELAPADMMFALVASWTSQY